MHDVGKLFTDTTMLNDRFLCHIYIKIHNTYFPSFALKIHSIELEIIYARHSLTLNKLKYFKGDMWAKLWYALQTLLLLHNPLPYYVTLFIDVMPALLNIYTHVYVMFKYLIITFS